MSSFYQDASLVMIPSGYKTSKVYSAVPTDGTGDLAFTRSNDTATRVGPDGLIEEVRTNLVLQSETFQTTWSPQIVTITANATTAPNGTLTADKLVAAVGAGTSVQHRVDQTTTSAIGINTFSVYGKKSEIDIIQLRIGVNGAGFDLTNGTTGGAAAGVTSSILNAGNGWYRCSITFTSVAANEIVRINLATTLPPPSSFIGDGVSGAFIWGAQLETGDIATDYIPTTTAAVSVGPVANLPRIDYTGGGCGKLLLEPQRTNYQLYSENSSQWSTPADGLTVVYNTSETIDPSGYYGAEKVTSASGNKRMFNGLTNPSGALTMSAFVKKGTGDEFLLRTTSSSVLIQYNLTTLAVTATAGTGTITNYGNGWYRVTASTSSAIANEVARYQFPNADGEYMYFWGAMVENGAYATSYIPTLAASVTRGADACSKTGVSSLIGQTEGTLFLDFESGANDSIDYAFTLNDGTTTNRIRISRGAGNTITAQIRVAAVTQALIQTATVTPNTRFKCALAYKLDDVALYVNGAEIGVDTSSTIPACSVLATNLGDGTGLFGRPINQALVFKTRLSNNALASLTTL